jgi:hypothetical protein
MEADMNARLRSVAKVAGGGVGALALLGVGYVTTSWMRYGKVSTNGKPDPLLDRFMASYEVREYHETRVAAPVEIAYEAVRAMDFSRSRLVRAVFRARQIALGARAEPPSARPVLEQTQALGWGVLAEEPGREIVMGAVTQPWLADVRFRSLPPEEFPAFNTPGYAKIVFTMSAEALGPMASVVRTETRVVTTDTYARERFRRYWAMVSPGVRLIRIEGLRLVRADAERRARATRAPVAAEVSS